MVVDKSVVHSSGLGIPSYMSVASDTYFAGSTMHPNSQSESTVLPIGYGVLMDQQTTGGPTLIARSNHYNPRQI